MDFGPIIDKILKVIPQERTTYLFSATMTTKVAKLQRASLSNPVRVEVSSKYVVYVGSILIRSQHHIYSKVSDSVDTVAILSPDAAQRERRILDLPLQFSGPKLNYHLHEDSERCCTAFNNIADTGIPCSPSPWSTQPKSTAWSSGKIQKWWA